ncbi:MAG: Gldg family protein [Desulfobulbus sp.]|jgi:ABC-2 type transport system permease protein
MNIVLGVARRELASLFATPAACIFLALFPALTLFLFFWVETFFARNIADVRPIFEWMPLLLLFLSASITMRAWSGEHRSGTLEILLTAPVSGTALMTGKFLACLVMVGLGLLLTLPLPMTVSLLGPLDWGPVWGGYLAGLILGGAYIAIGLLVSARCQSQIVSLLLTVLICGLLFLVGSDTLTAFFGNRTGELCKLLGVGSRFAAITRGVIDLRDLVYFASLTGLFFAGAVYTLERCRWAGNPSNALHRRWGWLTVLIVLNCLLVNVWLAPLNFLRIDLTQGQLHSLSPATRATLVRLQEPLLLRGYFSAQTHPALSPLVPQLRDLMREYEVAGQGRVRVEFVDPQKQPGKEQEAAGKYGIRPTPFQTASRYQTAVTNSYFDILVKYGDEFVVLGFQDLIAVRTSGETEMEVALRNPEYDLTRAVKKVLDSYRSGGNPFSGLSHPVRLHAYISPAAALPEPLASLTGELHAIVEELKTQGGERFSFALVDPDADGGATAKRLQQEQGLQPMVAGLLPSRPFWWYLVLETQGVQVPVALPEQLDRDALQRSIEAALKRLAPGMLKSVALVTPEPAMTGFGMDAGLGFQLLRRFLEQEYRVIPESLHSGQVDPEADVLVVAAPAELSELQRFAVDQFLMRGSTVVLAASPYAIGLQGGLRAVPHRTGLEDWLAGYGIRLEQTLVLDSQNAVFPVPVERQAGDYLIRETHLLPYPYFIDIREGGMDRESGLLTGIDRLGISWASPIEVEETQAQHRVVRLLTSSPDSWLSAAVDVLPDFERHGPAGFARGKSAGPQVLGVLVEGAFTSAFKGRPSPLLAAEQAAAQEEQDKDVPDGAERAIGRVIEHAPESARLLVFSSAAFLSDTSLELAAGADGARSLQPLQLIANCIDWSMGDRDLLSIRGRDHFARTLLPMDQQARMFWEYLNYGLAALGVLLIWLVQRLLLGAARRREQRLVTGKEDA